MKHFTRSHFEIDYDDVSDKQLPNEKLFVDQILVHNFIRKVNILYDFLRLQ